MRMLMDVTMPNEPFNTLVREGMISKKIGEIMETIKPEGAYFTEQDGKRGALIIVDVADPSKIPSLAEPFFLTFDAEVKFRIVMTVDDLKNAGLEALGKKWAEPALAAGRR